MMKRIALIGLLLVFVFSTAGSAVASVPAEEDKAPALAPGDTISPTGTITSNVPPYYWYPVSGATKYQIKLKKGFFKTVDDFKLTPGAAGCAATCWYYRAGILSNKDYKWKVRAKVGGNWQSWSDWESFTVNASGGFKSSFNKNANGWTKLNGNWKIAKGKYVTKGQQGFFATSAHVTNYANFTYEVKYRRVWDKSCSQGWVTNIHVRGNPYPLTSGKEWDDVMRFGFTNTGRYVIAERVNGAYNGLANPSSSAVKKGGWNTLLVVAKGSAYWLYINGEFVHYITDSSHSTGLVGLGFYQQVGCSDKYKVDWAKLSTSTPW